MLSIYKTPEEKSTFNLTIQKIITPSLLSGKKD